MPDITVEVEIFCGTCGKGLCQVSEGGNTTRRGAPYISVDACPKCMDAAKDKGYEEGYNDGAEAAHKS